MRKTTQDNPDKYPALGRAFMWVDRPGAPKLIVYGLYILCAGLFAADFLYHKHTYLVVEEIPGFYALFGGLVSAALIIVATGMRAILKRDESYYAPNDVEAEPYPEDQLDRVRYDD
ncbi:hypothetical protein [Sedimentitalea arenosa]|uniref:Uncharacterized protein n=1 Tax=Sedimentitalea arenosa TaxID=2798803 RepID=A0A8J7II40_9RHOB|nr:hypothetical protein [Arenibacterium arenosum]MBJ6371072.1 hypothetical protein [Arenibacterium arenosum]